MEEETAYADCEWNQVIKQNKILTNETTDISKQPSQALQMLAVFKMYFDRFLNEVVEGSCQ